MHRDATPNVGAITLAPWQKHWREWSTHPHISAARQADLTEHRQIAPDILHDIYPFQGIDPPLTRADIEWLLATHVDHGVIGPIDWQDPQQRHRLGLDLRGADLRGVDLRGLPLARMRGGLSRDERGGHHERLATSREQRIRAAVQFQDALLTDAHLESAWLARAHLEGANLEGAHLEEADLNKAYLQGVSLRRAFLGGAYLRDVHCDVDTNLNKVKLGDAASGYVSLVDAIWNGANLGVVRWEQMPVIGDEIAAHTTVTEDGKPKDQQQQNDESERAVRANRQLAAELHDQGLNEEADHFAYRAQICQRRILRRERRLGAYVGSLFLDILAGYGYKPVRSFICYALVNLIFAGLYLLNGHFVAPHLAWNEALVLSISSFHGRGFFTTNIALGDTYAQIAACEAFIGLIIEVAFIATFTQRFFAK